MTLDQLVDDTVDVTRRVCDRIGKKKVILVGQSWGSFLGVQVVKRHPGLFHAYVGTGQLVSLETSIADRVRWTRQQATAADDQATLKALDNAATLSGDARIDAENGATRKYALPPSDQKYQQMVQAFTGAPPFPSTVPSRTGLQAVRSATRS
jgi:pimeloyl-ACP methyl ester carboxylesterase